MATDSLTPAPTPEVREVAERLKAAREKLGKTQAQIAKDLDVTQPQIALWEGGERVPRTIDIRAIAKAYGLKPEQLLPKRAA